MSRKLARPLKIAKTKSGARRYRCRSATSESGRGSRAARSRRASRPGELVLPAEDTRRASRRRSPRRAPKRPRHQGRACAAARAGATTSAADTLSPPRRRSPSGPRPGRRRRRPGRRRPRSTGRSLAAIIGTASRTVVSTGSAGRRVLAGLGRRMIQRSVSTWLRGMSRTKFATYSSAGEPTSSSGVPSCTIWPSRMIAIRSPSRSASGRSCVMKTIVLPGLVLQPDHLVLHVAADQRVEGAERLVVEHHLRIDGERARQADALLHAARELVRELVGRSPRARRASAPLLRARGARPSARPGPRARTRRCRSRAGARAGRSAGRPSRRCAGAAARSSSLVGGGDVAAVDLDAARGRLDQPDQRADERRLAGAGEAHHDEHLAGPDVERDVADGGDAAVLLAQLGTGEVGVGGADHLSALRPKIFQTPSTRISGAARSIRGGPVGPRHATVPGSQKRPTVSPSLVDVDVEGGRRLAVARHRLHVAAERHDPAGARVGAEVADGHGEAGRRVRERRRRARARGASSPCRSAACRDPPR